MRKIYLYIGILFILFGLFLILMGIFDLSNLRQILCILVGVGMIIVNSFGMFMAANNFLIDRRRRLSFYGSLICVILGAFYIPWHNLIMSIICGTVLVIIPTVRIILAHDKLKQFRAEIVLYLVAITILFITLDIVFLFAVILYGLFFIGFGTYTIIFPYILFKRKKKTSIRVDINVHDVGPILLEDNYDDDDEIVNNL